MRFQAVWGDILEKYLFPDICFRKLNNWKSHLGKLEEGSVLPYFPSMIAGRKKPNFILIEMLHLDRIVALLWRWGGGGGGGGRSSRHYATAYDSAT